MTGFKLVTDGTVKTEGTLVTDLAVVTIGTVRISVSGDGFDSSD